MKIGIDASPALGSFGGVSKYVRSLLDALKQVQDGYQFIAYIPKGTLQQVEQKLGCSGDGFKLTEVSRWGYSWRGRIDGLDFFHGTNFKCQTRGRFGSVLTIHDLWLDRHPEYSKKLLGQRLSFFRTRRRVKDATHIVAVSEFTAREIRKFYGISSNKITVVYHGVSSNFFADRDPSRFSELQDRLVLPNKPYILFLGGAEPRKNHQTLFRAFSQELYLKEHFNLIVVGNPKYKNTTIWDYAQICGIHFNLISLHDISENDLRVLYSHAALFVFPSRYEGFGFPVLEAMACGAPVITSNTSALPEVAGPAAILVDPDDEVQLAQAMREVLKDPCLQDKLRQRGFERVKQFQWSKTADEMLQIYCEHLR